MANAGTPTESELHEAVRSVAGSTVADVVDTTASALSGGGGWINLTKKCPQYGSRAMSGMEKLSEGYIPSATRPSVKPPATWADPKTLVDHFERHGKDFGAKTPQEYVQMSSDFLRSSQNQRFPTKISPDGNTIRVYDPTTNIFGSYTAGGETRTFFKPDGHKYTTNLDYWNAQPGTSPWTP